MPYKKPVYPKELTNRWWQSNKGLIAKIATRDDGTGIGKKLTELESAFGKIDWRATDLAQFAPGHLGSRSADEVKQGVANIKKAAQDAQPVYKMATSLELEAKKLADVWSRDSKIPKSSAKAAMTISQKARELSFSISLGTFATYAEQGVKEDAEATRKNREVRQKAIRDVPAKLDTLVQNLGKGVTVDKWPSFWSQDVRFIGTQAASILSLYPAAAPEITELRKHSNKCNTPKDQNELNSWVQHMTTHATALRRRLP